ncbi:MAG: hypothetical protein NTY19_38830 [Planctomycetota bacterium]|nr:hypothetical protein [Planctomycetota bacterium]
MCRWISIVTLCVGLSPLGLDLNAADSPLEPFPSDEHTLLLYLRNERGFLTPTPYGDSFDVITNRCHQELLNQYPAIMLLGDVELAPDVVQRLTGFVRQGGDLLLDANHARALPELCSGIRLGENETGYVSRVLASGETFDEQPYAYTLAALSEADPLLTNERGKPLLAVQRAGRGRVVVASWSARSTIG